MTAEDVIHGAIRRALPLLHESAWEKCERDILAALAAAGWALVPKVPTPQMLATWDGVSPDNPVDAWGRFMDAAMLRAAADGE